MVPPASRDGGQSDVRVADELRESIATAYPAARVSIASGPIVDLSCETETVRRFLADAGGCAPQSASTSRSVGTVPPVSTRRQISSARCFAAVGVTSRPSSETSSGPRIDARIGVTGSPCT